MTIERYIRIIAGSFILISLALAHWVSPYWLWFTAFVGANLFQSGITRWCLMENILKKLGAGRFVLRLASGQVKRARRHFVGRRRSPLPSTLGTLRAP